MDEKTLQEYLKKHLSIRVLADYYDAYDVQVTVVLYLNDEEICKESNRLKLLKL